MNGFSADTINFLTDLRAHNSRDWFEANRPLYDQALRAASAAFCARMEPLLAAATGLRYRSRVFRINRDLRFSRDKSPYNTHIHIGFLQEGPGEDAPAWMVGLEPGQLSLGMGYMTLSSARLGAWRDRVSGPEGATLLDLLETAQAQGARLNPPDLKRVPAPYPADHPCAGLLRRKSLSLWLDFDDPSLAFGPDGPMACATRLRLLAPVHAWLNRR